MSDQNHTPQRKPRNWPSLVGTAEQRASKGLSRLEDITRLISEWAWEMDVEGRLTYASDRVTEVLGWLPIELNGKTFFQLGRFVDEAGCEITPDLEKPFREILFKAKSRNGDERLLLISGLPFYDKDTWAIEGYCGTAEDITKQRETLNEMVLAQREAEQANLAKSEFLSSMSHELRTPLNAILGFGELLSTSIEEPLSNDQKESVDHIIMAGEHLLDLINDILDLAKIEANKVTMTIEDVPIEAVIEEGLALVQNSAQDRGIKIVLGEGIKADFIVRADYIRLKQSLLNLISNAIKYNRENGTITIDCQVKGSSTLHISVTDTGAGIAEDMLDDLFLPFNRLNAEKSVIQGTGIGLAITKHLVECMDGQVGVKSIVGEGTTFWIALPLITEECADSASPMTSKK